MKKTLVVTLFIFLVFPASVLARIGVGIATGKIIVSEKLRPGVIYQLPPLTVINTGDEPSDYEASIARLEKQPELFPASNWFIFSPQKFHLEPGKVQAVDIKLNLPVDAKPGDYFAYVEGSPVVKTQTGQTTIGIAAAAKLYFTVLPANIFAAVYYKIVSFWQIYSPWPQRIVLGFFIVIGLLVFRKYFKIQVNMKDQNKNSEGDYPHDRKPKNNTKE